MSEVKKSFDITTDFGSQEMSEVYNYGKRKSRKRKIHSYYIAYHIGKHRIYEYNNTKVGKYKTLSQAAEKLIQIFKQEKIKELDNSLKWVKMQLKRKVIDTDLEELISQVKEIKSRLATDDKPSQSAFDEIVNTVNKNRTLTKNTSVSYTHLRAHET